VVVGQLHHHHGGNLQVISAPDGWPLWTSPIRPGREHDTTCIRHHQALPVIDQAADQLPTLADLGYEGEATTLRVPIKKPARGRLSDDQKTTTSSTPTSAVKPNARTRFSRPPSRRYVGSASAHGASAPSPPPRSSCYTTSMTAPHDQLPDATTSYREWLSG
jgi:hypothetical protein